MLGQVDVVIDAVGGNDIYKVGHTILDASISAAGKARPHGPPLSYIYCSGTWVHGDHASPAGKEESISDRTPIDHPSPLTAWRLEIERKALQAINKSFTANVLRPSLLYGGSGSLIGATLFKGAKEGKITWYGDEETRCATIHKEDLGEAFRLCAEKVGHAHWNGGISQGGGGKAESLVGSYRHTPCQAYFSTSVGGISSSSDHG